MQANYDFECSVGHVFEARIDSSLVGKKLRCKSNGCKRLAERVWLSPRASRAARNFEPALLYVRADGEVIAPGRSNPEHLPKSYRTKIQKAGFKQVELSTFRQYERFCASQRSLARDRRDIALKSEQQGYDDVLKQEIEHLQRGGEVEIPLEDGKGTRTIKFPPLRDMAPGVRRIAELAIEEARTHKIQGESYGQGEIFIQAFEQDGTSYCDRDTDWKRR